MLGVYARDQRAPLEAAPELAYLDNVQAKPSQVIHRKSQLWRLVLTASFKAIVLHHKAYQ